MGAGMVCPFSLWVQIALFNWKSKLFKPCPGPFLGHDLLWLSWVPLIFLFCPHNCLCRTLLTTCHLMWINPSSHLCAYSEKSFWLSEMLMTTWAPWVLRSWREGDECYLHKTLHSTSFTIHWSQNVSLDLNCSATSGVPDNRKKAWLTWWKISKILQPMQVTASWYIYYRYWAGHIACVVSLR